MKEVVNVRSDRATRFLVSTIFLALLLGVLWVWSIIAEPSISPSHSPVHTVFSSNSTGEGAIEKSILHVAAAPLGTEEFSHPGEIQGVVYRSNGKFATNAHIRVTYVSDGTSAGKEVESRVAEANDSGQFKLSGFPLGNYLVQANLGGEVAEQSFILTHASAIADVVLLLSMSNGIQGVVVDSDLNPIEGAMLHPWMRDGEIYYSGKMRMGGVKSDAQGTFELNYLPHGDWSIFAEAEGFGAMLSEPVPSGTVDLEIQLVSAPLISGRVVKEESPVEGALVQLISDDLPFPSHRVATGADGSFFFESVGPGNYLLAAEKDGDITRNPPMRISVGITTAEGLELELIEGGVVRGRIYIQETGEGIPDVEVGAYVVGETWKNRKSVPSAKDGNFEIIGLSTGTYTLRPGRVAGFARYGSTEVPPTVTVEAGRLREGVDIAIRKGITVSGRVLDSDDKPVAGAEVRGNREGWQDQQWSRADGTYILANITPGEPIQIKAEHSLAVSEIYGPYEVPPDGLTGIDLQLSIPRTGLIAGVVVDLRGRPVLGHVVATTNEKEFFAAPSFTTTDGQGRFLMPNVPPGAYELSARIGNGRTHNLLSLSLNAGQEIRDLRIVMEVEDVLEIAGTVRDEAGKPVRGASIQLGVETEPLRYLGLVGGRSGFNGEFRIPNLFPGNYRLEAVAGGYLNGVVDAVQAGDLNVSMIMRRSPRLSGTVVNAAGSPITQFDVAYVYRGDTVGESNSLRARWESFANASGAFEIIAPIGAFDVVARANGYSIGRVQTGVLDADESRDGLVIVLEKAENRGGRVVNSRGRPVKGALIFPGPLPQYPWESAAYAAAISDDKGRFEFAGSEPGRSLYLSAIHPSEGVGEVYLEDALNPVEILLQTGASLVVDVIQGREVAPGASVEIAGGESNFLITDQGGRVSWNNIPPGEFTLSASSTDRSAASDEQLVVLDSGMETRVELELMDVPEEVETLPILSLEKRARRD